MFGRRRRSSPSQPPHRLRRPTAFAPQAVPKNGLERPPATPVRAGTDRFAAAPRAAAKQPWQGVKPGYAMARPGGRVLGLPCPSGPLSAPRLDHALCGCWPPVERTQPRLPNPVRHGLERQAACIPCYRPAGRFPCNKSGPNRYTSPAWTAPWARTRRQRRNRRHRLAHSPLGARDDGRARRPPDAGPRCRPADRFLAGQPEITDWHPRHPSGPDPANGLRERWRAAHTIWSRFCQDWSARGLRLGCQQKRNVAPIRGPTR